ncbi:hypothetical protein N7462_008203 [Penicillium macrosclerotiorum]|uniref:uncharacterized protein n=1 Tax=Penicillium macrosclerotiorum TaxID=303699 RepID=UPI002549058C|nr:uncharacterized protein N7462_008203 [Penicillium macrosclerotiorum]KAJ5679959.1 hypothetical protein N7462_008203 [Penicillium macrosclerotiorum]
MAASMPHSGAQQKIEQPATSSMSMSMPMKRTIPNSLATPSPTMRVTSPMNGANINNKLHKNDKTTHDNAMVEKMIML